MNTTRYGDAGPGPKGSAMVADRSDGARQMLGDPDPQRSKRVMEAMLEMRKIDIAALKRAYDEQ